MLNLGFGEILIFSLLALVVVGPERLPTMIRFLGRQYGKLMRASRELRRAFYMEAERVESEERREKLQKAREEALRKQQEKMKQHQDRQENSPEGVSQDILSPTPSVSFTNSEEIIPAEPTPDPFLEFEESTETPKEFIPFDHEPEQKHES